MRRKYGFMNILSDGPVVTLSNVAGVHDVGRVNREAELE